jgi:hypothetical protein
MSEFIFMLTRDDVTVADAAAICEALEDPRLRSVGFKDVGLPVSELRNVVDILHGQGRTVYLEVVSESREDELRSVTAGVELGVDYLLGGVNASDALAVLGAGQAGIKYFPFAGEIMGHPSVLLGPAPSIVRSARQLAAMDGVAGLDLLAYRFVGDCERLLAEVVGAVDVPVIAAGTIDSLDRIRAVTRAGAWAFTVGTAAFEGRFVTGAPLPDQLRAILDAADRAAV